MSSVHTYQEVCQGRGLEKVQRHVFAFLGRIDMARDIWRTAVNLCEWSKNINLNSCDGRFKNLAGLVGSPGFYIPYYKKSKEGLLVY